jgi:dihydroneopterin aldolase
MRVVKLGGSLLDFEDLVPALRRWLGVQPETVTLLVVGGGRLADCIRDYDRLHGLDPEAAHNLAIRAMTLNAQAMVSLLPEAVLLPPLGEREQWHTSPEPRLVILEPESFLEELEVSHGVQVPRDWSLTSDSIAAEAAGAFGAEELVLLKSRLPAPPGTVQSAVAEGYVDELFPKFVDLDWYHIRCVNLRDPEFPQRALYARRWFAK